MKIRTPILLVCILIISVVSSSSFASQLTADGPDKPRSHSIEAFPIMALFGVYSAQYVYEWTEKDHLMVGLAYVNPKIYNRQDEEIGQLFAPTIPLGYRRYVGGNFHVEYQLWPAYNFYYDKTQDQFYNGFDLYSEFRAGYRLDLKVGSIPVFLNLQYVYGIGLYPGNKPESFTKVVEDSPPFHVPSVSVGWKF